MMRELKAKKRGPARTLSFRYMKRIEDWLAVLAELPANDGEAAEAETKESVEDGLWGGGNARRDAKPILTPRVLPGDRSVCARKHDRTVALNAANGKRTREDTAAAVLGTRTARHDSGNGANKVKAGWR